MHKIDFPQKRKGGILMTMLKLTATAAIGVAILSIASKPLLERRSFVCPGSGSIIGNLYNKNN